MIMNDNNTIVVNYKIYTPDCWYYEIECENDVVTIRYYEQLNTQCEHMMEFPLADAESIYKVLGKILNKQ